MTRKIKHVFFDLDHTLWDFDKNSALTFELIFKLNKIDINHSEFIEVYEPINLNYWKLYREERIDKQGLRYGRLKDSFNLLQMSIDDETILRLSIDYIEHLTTYNHLFEGAIELLEYLRPKYHLHIITNGFEEAQFRKLKNSSIDHYFKTITNSEMVGVKKPNPLIFEHALRLAEATEEESLMVGDSFEADIQGAINVGYDVIYFDPSKTSNLSDIKTVRKLSEIKQYL